MDIKENFYSKLQKIREDYEPEAANEKKGKLYGQKLHKKSIKTDPINASWHTRVAKGYGDEAKRLNKKAVTGLDEEQLDELKGLTPDAKKKLQARIRDKHDKAWDDTIEIRKKKKSAGSADTKDMDKYRNRLAKMHNKLDEATEEEKRQKRLQKWIPKEKKKKLGKNAELVAGWKDDIAKVRAGMKARAEKKK